MATLMKEFHKLLRGADKLYDGQVEFAMDDGEKVEVDENENEQAEEDLNVYFFVTPNDGLYRNARVKFHMSIDSSLYPNTAPAILCKNAIYHPNINFPSEYEPGADICVNLLDSDWEPEVGLDGAVMAVLFLFYNPQLDDALSPVCCDEDYDKFVENVRRSLRGEEINGYCFDKLLTTEAVEEHEKDAKDSAEVITPPPQPTAATVTNNDNASEEIKEGAVNVVTVEEDSKTHKQVEDDTNNDVSDTTAATVTTATTQISMNDGDVSMDDKAESVGAESGANTFLDERVEKKMSDITDECAQNTSTETESLDNDALKSTNIESGNVLQNLVSEIYDTVTTNTPSVAATFTAVETKNENVFTATTHSTIENALSANAGTTTTAGPKTIKSAIKLLFTKIKDRFTPIMKFTMKKS